jgi:hypothetical protein
LNYREGRESVNPNFGIASVMHIYICGAVFVVEKQHFRYFSFGINS